MRKVLNYADKLLHLHMLGDHTPTIAPCLMQPPARHIATVAGITAAAQGHVLKVTYKGGEAEVIVAPDTPIVTMLQVMPPC